MFEERSCADQLDFSQDKTSKPTKQIEGKQSLGNKSNLKQKARKLQNDQYKLEYKKHQIEKDI